MRGKQAARPAPQNTKKGMEIWNKGVKALAALGGAIAGFFGEWSVLLTVLLSAMSLDYASGVLVGVCNRSLKTPSGGLSSKIGFSGLLKKGMILLIVLLATLVDKAVGSEGMVFQSAVVCYYIANEGLSILENAALLGLPIPAVIRRALEVLRTRGEETEQKKPDSNAPDGSI